MFVKISEQPSLYNDLEKKSDVYKRQGYKKWSMFFEAFGVNPLFMYVLGGVLSILFGSISFPWGNSSISIHGFLYNIVLMPVFGETAGSLAFALLFRCAATIPAPTSGTCSRQTRCWVCA